jgi:NAD(P)-dependent dehydrogenase (short-subunit alcohol dehydrogenase family)
VCYCCKVKFRRLHHFYDRLCPPCADLNWAKRHALASCRGKIAIVTGARVKIGYQTVLKLLRSGATVVATSRFPNSTVEAYRKEEDFAEFHSRLHVYGLDLRDVTGIEAFTLFMKQQFPAGIDILIHNACQTIRRPVPYYSPLVDQEQAIWRRGDETHRQILSGCVQFERARSQLYRHNHRSPQPEASSVAPPVRQLTSGQNPGMEGQSLDESDVELVEETTTIVPPQQQHSTANNGISSYRDARSDFETTGVSHSAALSQVALVPEDVTASEDVLPPGAVDINGQQLDLRSVNSWVLKMDQVSTPEVMECFFVNAIAPFVLNSRLLPLLRAAGDASTRPDRFIVNVSAMEGKFSRQYKSPNHPHTNMAKAALNMLTRTSAGDLASRHRIYMNSVDTGWINDENPLERASKFAHANDFQTPLDEIDAAARILDPIFSSLNGEVETPVWGKFLKDYKETGW